MLTNGARFYVDHAHPEYSSPEVTTARDLVIWDKAGERILEDAAARAAATLPAGSRVLIHKNNTDGKGAAYGTHENYLVPREVPFGRLPANCCRCSCPGRCTWGPGGSAPSSTTASGSSSPSGPTSSRSRSASRRP